MFRLDCVFPVTTKIVLFDMDGVLALSEPVHYEAWRLLADELGFVIEEFITYEQGIGVSDELLARRAVNERKLSATPAAILARKEELFLQLLRKQRIESPTGCQKFVEACRSSYRIALVSSSSRPSVDGVLESAGLKNLFEFYITGSDVQNHKPAPDPYLLALQRAGVAAAEAVAIEDSGSGIAAAQAAGICVYALESDFPALVAKYTTELTQ